ncbi:peptidylprolyl isomerase [Qipengyuania sediminis]|uniref:peptidylprolyl isomerase n=1 Tax=Qipengyuania sediminis TaxID=1532023 RepID=UPI0010596CB1|nr:peptidylprolyl isomerase [Qipengyuania sediminis]
MKTLAIAAAALATSVAAQETPKGAPSPSEIVAAAPARDWVAIAPSDLLVMTLAPDRDGNARQVVIQLMPPPFSQGWIANIRKLAAARWWDGLSVNRVQDNYVVQWGDPDSEDKASAKALPAGLAVPTEAEYTHALPTVMAVDGQASGFRTDPEITRARGEDAYAALTGFVRGFPAATTKPQDGPRRRTWPVHCYGMVGVGRGLSPDTGSGAELYTVIGHAPRHLDRNIALVGRVVSGIEHLSSLPRGTGALGFYETPEERTRILTIRLASELPEAERPEVEYLSTESDSFAAYAEARTNRRDPFFIVPAGGADICNIPVPVRRVAG